MHIETNDQTFFSKNLKFESSDWGENDKTSAFQAFDRLNHQPSAYPRVAQLEYLGKIF